MSLNNTNTKTASILAKAPPHKACQREETHYRDDRMEEERNMILNDKKDRENGTGEKIKKSHSKSHITLLTVP